jgi:hypothetical protein
MVSTLLNGNVAFVAAKKANSPADVVGKLVEYGLPSSSDTHTFAEELFSRVPRQASGVNVSFFFFLIEIFAMHRLAILTSIFFIILCLFSLYLMSVTALSETREGSCNVGKKADDL